MTNEHKAREIISQWKEKNKFVCNFNDIQALGVALEMAEWKDNESKKHNDELIDKACEMYKKELDAMNHIVRLITGDMQNLIRIDESVEEFRKLLKFECYEKKR